MRNSPVGLFGRDEIKREKWKMPDWLFFVFVEVVLVAAATGGGIMLEEYGDNMYMAVVALLRAVVGVSFVGALGWLILGVLYLFATDTSDNTDHYP